MTAITYAPAAARRMARITWRRHRFAVAGILGLFGVATAVLVAEGVTMRLWIDSHGLTHCPGLSPAASLASCRGKPGWLSIYDRGFFFADITAKLLLALPGVAALFAGVPWLAREFETGSFRYTWVQGISPVRWLLGVFGSLAGMAAVAAVVCGVVFGWWYRVAQWAVNVIPNGGWDWDAFGLSPIAMVSWTVFAMALAMLAAAVFRRTVPAMASFAVTYAGGLTFTLWWLRPRLLTIAPAVIRAQLGYVPGGNDLWLNAWFTGPDGHVLTLTQESNVVWRDPWLTGHHYTYWIAYQPHGRLVLFQLALAFMLLVLSAASVLAAVWLLRRQVRR